MCFVEIRAHGHQVVDRKYRQFNRLSLNLLNNSRGKTKSLQSTREIKAGDGSIWKTSLIRGKFETSSRLTLHAKVVDCQTEGTPG